MYQPDGTEEVITLDDWPRPIAGGPTPEIIANETTTVLRYFCGEGDVAVVRFQLVNTFMFGAPNDEALHGHPLYGRGLDFYSVHEVRNSPWVRALERMNSVHPRHDRKAFLAGRAHYILTFQDSTFEIVAHIKDWWKPVVSVFKEQDAAGLASAFTLKGSAGDRLITVTL